MYRHIYDLYYNELCLYVLGYTKERAQAEDIVQNVMLSVWKNRKKLKVKTSLKSYLYKSCYYEFVDSYKKRRNELSFIDQTKMEALDVFIEEDDEYIQKRIKDVHAEIENLPPKCKHVFVLAKFQGLRYKEVAEQLNISVKTVEGQMTKAMTRLKDRLGR
ncbi:RNA polymerase sigma-70 factor [Aquimarina sp. TRL1]|uniref:RNA polymerase sigma factor n=1 Tax=Aquimarina sp. (strain TRL1) TaxID=2736252 RepID=UPI00158B6F3D|nr:RNA polymerase sigma-70 factor [Aquimarina sp. TRL1]QKX06241.1 RNA polymerase sigma-70 factor [Aquimarina sp. TRL1]